MPFLPHLSTISSVITSNQSTPVIIDNQFTSMIIYNPSLSTFTSDLTSLQDWNNDVKERLYFNTILLWIYCIVGLLGNIVVIFFYTFRIKGKMEDRFLIPHLAFFDLLATLMTTVDKTIENVFPVVYPSKSLCQILNFSSRVFSATGDGILLLIAFHRYQRICRPFISKLVLFENRINVILVFLVAVVLNLPVFMFYELHQVHHHGTGILGLRCDHIHHNSHFSDYMTSYDVLVFAMIVAAMLVISILYISIARKIKTSAKKIIDCKRQSVQFSSTTYSNTVTSTSRKQSDARKTDLNLDKFFSKENAQFVTSRRISYANDTGRFASFSGSFRKRNRSNRFSYMFMTIALLFIFTYMPSNILKMCELSHPELWLELQNWKLHMYLFIRQLYILNHVINPFVYGLFDSEFRRSLMRSFKCSKH